MSDSRKEMLSFRVSASEIDELLEKAGAEGRTLSDYIRVLSGLKTGVAVRRRPRAEVGMGKKGAARCG